MRELFDKKNSEKGMVTVEATIALTTYLFVFITIFSLITICRAQARIQVALNNTAQEISQYSYIYGMTGLDQSLAKFQTEANNTKTQVNGLVENTVNVFESIQTLGDDAKSVNFSDVGSMLDDWDKISEDLNAAKDDFSAVKSSIEAMAADPQRLLFGMAKLIGSEGLEIAKSKAIAEPVARALIQKHLKRTNDDNADAFCKSVGIVPGSYFGTTSYFNGIDFSNSTLFAYGSPEISLRATYKVKLLKLLPIDVEYTITQSATTRGWLHGNMTENSATDIVDSYKSEDAKKVGASVWNSQSVNERNKIIRSLELDKLKAQGYTGVSGETYIQAYDEASNTATLVALCNPMYGANSVEDLEQDTYKQSVTDDIKRIAAQIKSSTDNRQTITIKEKDANGNITTRDVDCSKTDITQKVILIVPEDAGVKDYVQKIVNECGYSGMFSIKAGYGTGMKATEPTTTEGEEE